MSDHANVPRRVAFGALMAAAMLVAGSASAERTLTFAHVLETDHPYHLMAERFKAELEERAPTLRVEIFPAGQLGDERTLLEGLQTGSIDITTVTSALTANFVPEFEVMSLPFIFRDVDHLFAVMDGEIGNELGEALREHGFVKLGYGYGGVRDMYAHDPVRNLDELQGMQIRTMENSIIIDTWDALGADPDPISWGDVYLSLQQRLVDGAEGTGVSYRSMGFHELAPHFTRINYIFSWHNVLMSELAYEALTDEERAAVHEAAEVAVAYEREVFIEQEQALFDELRELGVTIHDVEDGSVWAERALVVYEQRADELGGMDWINRIREYR